jgi:hypothetical protein
MILCYAGLVTTKAELATDTITATELVTTKEESAANTMTATGLVHKFGCS